MSLWKLPGFDKDTFYAAALYLHAAVGTLKSTPWSRGPKTPQATRDFLDCLADCFARSKGKDARDHVSATAMVRDDEAKRITLYIAKNRSKKGGGNFFSGGELEMIANENDLFASNLVDWFSTVSGGMMKDNLDDSEVFKTMCTFSCSRVQHYIEKISDQEPDDLERIVTLELEGEFQNGWKFAREAIGLCKQYRDVIRREDTDENASHLLIKCARLGGQIRKASEFQLFTDKVESSTSRSKLKNLPELVKWINYLGRLSSAWVKFYTYCTAPEQSGYQFEHRLLPSQEDEWNGPLYLTRIRSWTGGLTLVRDSGLPKIVDGKPFFDDRSLEVQMDKIVKSYANVARVHCEMQLLLHFSQPDAESCMDYFGCSKKSCWLCWQILLKNSKYSMKDTHRKLYPRWAFPFDFSPLHPAIAEGIRAANNEMLHIINEGNH